MAGGVWNTRHAPLQEVHRRHVGGIIARQVDQQGHRLAELSLLEQCQGLLILFLELRPSGVGGGGKLVEIDRLGDIHRRRRAEPPQLIRAPEQIRSPFRYQERTADELGRPLHAGGLVHRRTKRSVLNLPP